ncbi:FHA domain-containing protein [Psychrobacter sp. CAM01]|uniref:FHA domain-containing protein n=1 Tax=Psychrobacter sp. CAM01 TaxID=3080335 RepID=UPI0029357659|nr:FHA domain-containing protein [Psychrobacter sp. CAM01]MDV2860524.1 FHA domain-containing protein [Psychrobacter sp. CAM01]
MMNHTDNAHTTADADSWRLNALTEALGDLTLTVTDSLSVGRGSDNDVVLGSKQVSRNHAVLSVLDGQLYVKDLDSSNGTFVNDQRLEGNKSTPLQAEDTLGFASFRFQVSAPVRAQEAAQTIEQAASTDEVAAASTPVVDTAGAPETPVIKETGIDEVLSAAEQTEPVNDTPMTQPASAGIKEEAIIEPVTEQPVAHKAPTTVDQTMDEAVPDEHDKTTKTALQEEADPEVLRAKQAATAQFSGTANLGQERDLGTEGNNAMDQAINNPANAGQIEKKPSGGWFVWVFIAILIIGLALWLFNMGGA